MGVGAVTIPCAAISIGSCRAGGPQVTYDFLCVPLILTLTTACCATHRVPTYRMDWALLLTSGVGLDSFLQVGVFSWLPLCGVVDTPGAQEACLQ